MFSEDLSVFDAAASEMASNNTYCYRLKTYNGYKMFSEVKLTKGNHVTSIITLVDSKEEQYVSKNDISAEEIAKEREILKEQAMNEGKPAEIAEKMVQGRIGKFYSEICLLDQEFVKDPSVKVGDLIKNKGSEMTRYARFEKGEGIEKKEENFAEEVMKQLQ